MTQDTRNVLKAVGYTFTTVLALGLLFAHQVNVL
jgi:hypothetical protein